MTDSQHDSLKNIDPNATGDIRDSGAMAPYVAAADTLKGDAVLNRAGERLGRVERIILDVPGGRIAYAVLTTDGCFDIGDRLLAVPWGALVPNPESDCFVLDVSRDQLAQAPTFDKTHWPSMADADWAREVHTYFRARPYYWG